MDLPQPHNPLGPSIYQYGTADETLKDHKKKALLSSP